MLLVGWAAAFRTPDLARRLMGSIRASAFGAALRHWHEKIRPKHFTHAGAKEYEYVPRQGEQGATDGADGRRIKSSYTIRKLRKYGHTYPLVLTGRSQQQAQAARIVTTGKGGRAYYNIPTFNLNPATGRINKREEFTRISAGDGAVMTEIVRRTLEQEVGLALIARNTIAF